MFDFVPTSIDGCYGIQPRIHADHRGLFIKIFHSDTFREKGLADTFEEVHYSICLKNVFRGLHFQKPPHTSAMVVSSIQGRLLAVVIDLRKASPTYRSIHSLELDSMKGNMMYIPEGLAYGYLSMDDQSLLLTLSTKELHEEYRSGIDWRSIDFPWPVQDVLVAEDDERLTALSDFESPF
jgi:dTDP-4-dehydrorhamnose 3,5-epimerase